MSDERIPLARPAIGEAEKSAVLRALEQPRLTGGAERLRFEERLTKATARRHALAVSSGTTALELALRALGVGAGRRVLVTAFGFPAAANAASQLGAEVVAVDVDPQTWTADLAQARARADVHTALLVTIDQLGACTESTDIEAFERETGMAVISDAACGLGSRDASGRPGAGAGRVATLSFHPRKVITTGEGGALVCDDAELYEVLVQLHNQGQSAPGRFARPGTNARMDEIRAALGTAQLARLEALLAERNLLAAGYHERLGELRASEKLDWQVVPPQARHAYQTFAVRLSARFERQKVIEALGSRGIEAGPATYAFPKLLWHQHAGDAPHALALHERALALPLFIGMRSSELDRVALALSEALQ